MKTPRDLKAVAVEYGNKSAPSVVAKASGQDAQQMIDHAFDAEKPVIHDPGLIEAMDGWSLTKKYQKSSTFQ